MKIPSRIPGDLSIRGGSPTFSGGPANFHYAIGGLPFLKAPEALQGGFYSGDRRIHRATAQVRKQQFDNQQTPGEQSLDGFWIRSQMSFHGGAGQLFSDPNRDNPLADVRFYRSKNVDPWTKGQLSLLNATTQSTPATAKASVLELFSIVTGDGTAAVVQLRLTDIVFLNVDGTVSAKAAPSGANMRSVTSNGNAIFVASDDGLWKAAIPTAIGTALSWTKIYTYASATGFLEVAWVKERLVLGSDNSLYELSPNPAGPPAALPTAFYVAKPTNWTWTSISETSPAIYAVGSAGHVSSILKFTLDTSGALPVLTGGSVAATLPGGEKGVAVFGYLGNFLGIGTSKGARVAESDAQGNLVYGPLLFESAASVSDFTARDRFLYCTYADSLDTGIKLARVDLSLQIEPLRFAWASDLSVSGDTTASSSCAFYGNTDQLAFATAQDSYREDETKRQLTGYLYTSRIRFSTLDPKNFRSFRVRGPQLAGALGIATVDNTGTETPVVNFGVGEIPGASDVTMPSGSLQDFMQLKFVLNSSGATNDVGAIISGWQMKALPGSPRQRMITLPLLCYDWEVDKFGQRVGGNARALPRLLALENLESMGGVTTFQDIDADISYEIYIEDLEFLQWDCPPGFQGWGGIIVLQFRTV